MKAGNALILLAAAAALAGIVWWNWSVFATIGVSMPAIGWVALTLGVVLSLVVGVGLMFLVFYSSRHGYDDAAGTANEAQGETHAEKSGRE